MRIQKSAVTIIFFAVSDTTFVVVHPFAEVISLANVLQSFRALDTCDNINNHGAVTICSRTEGKFKCFVVTTTGDF